MATLNRLSTKAVEKLTKPGRHADGGNLYLSIRPGGSKQWVLFYRSGGKLKEMSLGGFPAISLARARNLATDARAKLSEGTDPLSDRRAATRVAEAVKQAQEAMPTFGAYALLLVETIEAGFRNPKHRQQWRNTLTTYCKPIWETPLDRVDTAGVLECLTPIWQSKAETASRLRGRIERVLNAAKARGYRKGENPAAWRGHLDATLPRPDKLRRGHHKALPYREMGAFITDLRTKDSTSALALEFLILTATRTVETLGARHDEIDLASEVWTIPAARMKAGRTHTVPLSRRAIEIVHRLAKAKTGVFVFPGRDPRRPLSNMSLLQMLRRMKRDDLTAHGFRSSFSDWASEISPFSAELRETALAHVIQNKAEAAYRRGDALEKRKNMMESWAAWCEPRSKGNVVHFAKAQAE